YMGYNMPQGVMIETSRESSFKSGLVDYRAMAIADTKPLVPEAFIKLSKKQA
ncbi:phage major capsid protein, partial [Bacillus cereus]|nr:phage major capsid protein [Bacillus cereus]